MNLTDTLVGFGGACKALGNGRIGGHLVLFGDPSSADLAGDYFTAETDYSLDTAQKSRVYYQHTMDKTLGNRSLGLVELKADPTGIWAEGQMALRDGYEERIYEMVKAGKLGWSSGTARHLMRKEPVGDSYKITHWPLGADATLSPTPMDPRTRVVALKSLFDDFGAEDVPHVGMPLDDHSRAALESVKGFLDRLEDWIAMKSSRGRPVQPRRIEQFQALHEQLGAILRGLEPKPDPRQVMALKADLLELQALMMK